jgi:DNA-binding transcriptional MerR regulator
MQIGELSARTGRTAHTLRWYDAQRLIPGVRRDAGGRRVFREEHVLWLHLLDRLRASGMSIRQMREYTALVRRGESTLDQRRDLLAVHRQRVRRSIDEFKAAAALIDAKIVFYERWIASGQQPDGWWPPPKAGTHAPRRNLKRRGERDHGRLSDDRESGTHAKSVKRPRHG